MVSKYKSVGENHNLNLSIIYNYFKENNVNISSKEKLIEDFRVPLSNVLNSSSYFKQFNISQSDISNITDRSYNGQFVKKDNLLKSASDSLASSANFSKELSELLTRLINISENNTVTIQQEAELIESLNDEAASILTDERELNIYFCAASVAKSSFEYWANNIGNWMELFSGEQKLKSAKVQDPMVMLDGIKGADVGGAVAGAIASVITGPGVLPCALAGSTAASTGKFIENAWNYFF